MTPEHAGVGKLARTALDGRLGFKNQPSLVIADEGNGGVAEQHINTPLVRRNISSRYPTSQQYIISTPLATRRNTSS